MSLRVEAEEGAGARPVEPWSRTAAGFGTIVFLASDLMLFLWQRLPADRLEVTGDRAVLANYFTLVPPM